MDIDTVRALKEEAEASILQVIRDFEARTGVYAHSISLSTSEHRTAGVVDAVIHGCSITIKL